MIYMSGEKNFEERSINCPGIYKLSVAHLRDIASFEDIVFLYIVHLDIYSLKTLFALVHLVALKASLHTVPLHACSRTACLGDIVSLLEFCSILKGRCLTFKTEVSFLQSWRGVLIFKTEVGVRTLIRFAFYRIWWITLWFF